jgi:hypothetical protein
VGFLYEWSIWKLLFFATLWGLPLTLLHELGHGLAALWLTRGPVLVRVGAGPALPMRLGRMVLVVSLLGPGHCAYDPATLRGRPRSEALIGAAGPIASLVGAAALALLAAGTSGELQGILASGALCSALAFALTAIPMRYGSGLRPVGESDGMGIWRILTGGPRRRRRERKEPAVAGPVYLILLALATVLAFMASIGLGIALVGMFGLAFLAQSERSG